MDTISVDGLSPGNSESGEDMEDRQSVEENVTEDCMEYRGKPYTELTLDDLSDVEFRTVDEVDKFYSYYSLAKGFSMRKHRYDKNRAGTVILCRQLVCSRQGQRRENSEEEAVIDKPWLKGKNVLSPQSVQKAKDFCSDSCGGSKRISSENVNPKPRKHTRRLTRGNCQASLTVRLCKDRGVYYASEFITDHNHDLTRVEHRHFLRSHRKVKDSDIASVLSMRKVSVKTSCAYEFLVHVAGGYEFVGFTIRDLYNKLKEARAEIILDGDAQSSVTWMNMKAMRDPHFYCIFSVDQSGRLANMFWRDGQSLVDYNSFGEILIFDSTYKSNIYGKPLAVFVGCNNHRATVIYGCALLVDETEETYLWLLSSFLTSMYGKKPCSVVTDGDEAIRNAVCCLLPDARHRICAWHIGRNVCSNLKGIDIQKDFFHFIFAGLTVEEWETGWQYFVSMNQLENNKWVTGMYNKRERWAESFFREQFFGGISSTQRCEEMNRNLKGGIGRTMMLFEVLPRMEKTIARIRNRVAEDDYKSEQFLPVCGTHMRCLQEEVGRIFTHDIFLLIKDQINYETKFVVVHRDAHPTTGMTLLSVTQYGKAHRRWIVWYQRGENNSTFDCSCKLFQSDGIPCCHIFCVMKYEQVTTFPQGLINERWTKAATVKRSLNEIGCASGHSVQVARYGELMAIAASICHTASYNNNVYDQTRESLFRLNLEMKKTKVQKQCNDDTESLEGLHPNVIRDPIVCRSKGSRSKSVAEQETDSTQNKGGGKCTVCGLRGHNRRTCEIAKQNEGKTFVPGSFNSGSTSDGHIESLSSLHDDMQTESEADNETSDGNFDRQFWKSHKSTGLMHHNEEVRSFEFVGGYDNNDSIRTHSMSYAPSTSIGLSSPIQQG